YIPGFPNLIGAPTRAAEPAPQKAPAAAAPTAAVPVTVAGAALPWSVNVANYDAAQPAFDHVRKLTSRFQPARFFIVPEPTQGVLYWKVMGGMADDSTALAPLRDQLIAAGELDEEAIGGRSSIFQPRPLAYELGEFRTEAEAVARADSLTGRAIPAYVAAVPYSDGTERWKVYGGAYRDSASAAPMQKILAGASIQPRLVERSGRPPASPK
ncbi:MAG TPA: SPOR domain-containing protein, partial [Longimicrobium sp.]|nr:SPOR domain-containing protein [Longimicrobium sp.]